jgi:outer membrane protein OmpA-like peptidoglycan-associated protein
MNFTRIVSRTLFLFLSAFFFTRVPAQIRLAAVGGLHSSSFPETNSIPGFDTAQGRYTSSKTGFQLGVLAEIPIGHQFFFQPGINYSSKGNTYERFYDTSQVQSDTLYNQHTLNLNYVEIPLYLTYKIPLSRNKPDHFFLSAGPYFAFIFSASKPYQNRVKFFGDNDYTYNSGTEDLEVGNAPDKYKTLDVGINVKAGFELGNVMLGAYFSRGLTNAYQADYASSFHHQLIGATLGIWLAKSKPVPQKAPVVIADGDRDGTPDINDSCKTIAGLPRYHGCPIPDSDHDGVNDEADSCKYSPGLSRYHGCPIPDSDQDGVNDEEDSCRDLAGVARYHGCPIPDKDHDGLNDEADKCPDQPGKVENSGCPVIQEALVKRILFVARNVQFRLNSIKLTSGSLSALRELADTLSSNPDLELTVEGHTDNTGKPAYNQQLSLQRAMQIKNELVKLRVPEQRISTKGFGDTQPIADNKTEQGRSQNRRVVFTLHVKNR